MTLYDKEKTLITKENADEILKAFAKEYKKQYGICNPVEIIIVGGGSILLNYDFRLASQDFDITTQPKERIKEITGKIADQYNLPDNWMNMDFMKTASYSDKLREVSKYYRSFNNESIEFRTVKAQYLIAMKMVSAREYRNDISDIVGILSFMKKNSEEISIEIIDAAIDKLYGDRSKVIKDEVYNKVRGYVDLTSEELDVEYERLHQSESELGQALTSIDKKYSNVVKEDNIQNIIASLKRRQEKK